MKRNITMLVIFVFLNIFSLTTFADSTRSAASIVLEKGQRLGDGPEPGQTVEDVSNVTKEQDAAKQAVESVDDSYDEAVETTVIELPERDEY